jgi:phosphonate transport system substrate-binding protein
MQTKVMKYATNHPAALQPPAWRLIITALLLLMALLLFLIGCDTNDTAEQPVIRLDKVAPLPESAAPIASGSLRVAVAAIISPQGTIQSYQSFMHYLEEKTGRKVVLVQRKTYQEVNDMLARGVVEVAFVCTGAYWEGSRAGSMDLLVVPQVNGKHTYQSLLIVPQNSSVTAMDGLRDKVFAFTDPPTSQVKAEKAMTFAGQGLCLYRSPVKQRLHVPSLCAAPAKRITRDLFCTDYFHLQP